MSKLEAHSVYDSINHEDGSIEDYRIAMVHPASSESVKMVLDASENDMDGRSNWVWVRLANGDLVLGVFPQGDTYMEVEQDATYPGD